VAVFTAIAAVATGGAVTGAGFAPGYHAAEVAAALAVITLVAVPAVRPAPGTRAGGPHGA
jgi:hypothetical protein